MGCQGRALWDCTRLIMGCLGKKPEVEKGMDLDGLGKEELWENRGVRGHV